MVSGWTSETDASMLMLFRPIIHPSHHHHYHHPITISVKTNSDSRCETACINNITMLTEQTRLTDSRVPSLHYCFQWGSKKKLCIAFCLVKISPLIRTVFLISAREYFVENQFRLNQIALTATGEGRGRFLPSESGISEPGTPSQVPQPTCFWKWHSWQLGNLTTEFSTSRGGSPRIKLYSTCLL